MIILKKVFLIFNLFILLFVSACLNNNANVEMYDIHISDELEDLGLSSSLEEAKEGEVITLEFNGAEGIYIEYIYVNGEALEGMTFVMPDEDVVITVTFKENSAVIGAEAYLYELFGSDIETYTNNEENPYNIDLNKYGTDVIVYFYEPELGNDPYVNVNKAEFYADYESATSYEEAYYRTQHKLMSGDITDQTHEPVRNALTVDGVSVRITTAVYVLDTDGDYLAYVPNVLDGENYIIFYGGAYTSLNEVAAYLLAFGEVPVNSNYDKSKGKQTTVKDWGKYGRVNNSRFSGDTSKYPYEPLLPCIQGSGSRIYYETDFGTLGGYTNSNPVTGTTYTQTVYNNGSGGVTRGSARFVFVHDSSVSRIDDRYVFYTYNHYNDFEEYLNYHDGWGVRFGNESAGNYYCGNTKDYTASAKNKPTDYPQTLLQKYSQVA